MPLRRDNLKVFYVICTFKQLQRLPPQHGQLTGCTSLFTPKTRMTAQWLYASVHKSKVKIQFISIYVQSNVIYLVSTFNLSKILSVAVK